MKRLTLLALSVSAWGTVTTDPPNCSSRPCTYTATCNAAQCTSAEADQLQGALDAAYLGDTIILQAGRTWDSSGSRFRITGRPGSLSDYLTIRTSNLAGLPPEGARVTPQHVSAMPTLRAPSGVNYALRIAGGATRARNIRIVGVHFTSQSGGGIGSVIWMYDNAAAGHDRQSLPDNIEFKQIISRRTVWDYSKIGQNIGMNGDHVLMRDSYLQGAMDPAGGSERQNIGITICLDCQILNNALFDAAGENIIWGGTGRPYNSDPTSSGQFAYNAVLNHKERMPTLAWTPNTRYFKGVVVKYTTTGANYMATATCVSGASFTVSDNGCNWVSASAIRHMKNNFEIKDGQGIAIHHNLFDGFWMAAGGADQYENVTFKISSCPVLAGSGCQAIGPWNGTCNVNGAVVTSSNPLPESFSCGSGNGRGDCEYIKINGTNRAVADFDLTDPYRLVLVDNLGTLTNVPYTYGSATYTNSWSRENNFEHNIVRNGPQPFQIVQQGPAHDAYLGRSRIRNNLFYRIDCNEFATVNQGCNSLTTSRYIMYMGGVAQGYVIENNTIVDTASHNYSMLWDGTFNCRGIPSGVGTCPGNQFAISGDTIFRNNIMRRGNSGGLAGATPAVSAEGTVLAQKVCLSGTCPKSQWSGNIIAGVATTTYPSGTTYNLCSTAAACTPNFDYADPVYGTLFEDYANRKYKVRTGHYAQKGGYGGKQIGANWEQLPALTKPSNGGIGVDVSTTTTTATLTWNVMSPMKHIGCTVHVSSTADMDTPIADLDGATQGGSASVASEDGLTRSIVVGSRVALTSGTTYYAEVHCGSVERVTFTTQ